jgi:uncharacterized glyoxalase superfamily protein PhnB
MGRDSIEAPRIYPALRYRDAVGAIDFLCRALGFATHVKYTKSDKVQHAQLAFGSSMIMIGSADDARPSFAGLPTGQPAGKSIYIAVDDVDQLFARAKSAGAEILEPPTDRDYGSREFICADPEGNVWSFGTYWPKANEPPHD